MLNPFELISDLASGKAGKSLNNVFDKMGKIYGLNDEQIKSMRSAVKHTAKLVEHKKKLQKINKSMEVAEKKGDKEAQTKLRIQKGYQGSMVRRRLGWLKDNPYKDHAREAITPGNSRKRDSLSSMASSSQSQGKNKSRSGFAYSLFQMLGNFLGGEFYYFAKGINQASKRLMAFGILVYAGMRAQRLLTNVVHNLVKSFRELIEQSDKNSMHARRTSIQSGGFQRAHNSLRSFRRMQATGQSFMTAEEYVESKRRLHALGKESDKYIKSFEKISLATGESASDLIRQYHASIMHQSDEIYQTLGKNNIMMQKIYSVFPRATNSMREAIDKYLNSWMALNENLAKAPRTVEEIKRKIHGFKELMIMNIVGNPSDKNSLAYVYKNTFERISQYLNDHEKEFTQLSAYVSRVAKTFISIISKFMRYMTTSLRSFIKNMGTAADEFPKKLLVFEFRLKMIAIKIERFYKSAIPFIKEFSKAVWSGLMPIRMVLNAMRDLLFHFAKLVGFISGEDVTRSSFFMGLVKYGVMIWSVFKVTKMLGFGLNLLSRSFGKLLSFSFGKWMVPKIFSGIAFSFLRNIVLVNRLINRVPVLANTMLRLGSVFTRVGTWFSKMGIVKFFGGLAGRLGLSTILRKIPIFSVLYGLYDAVRHFQHGNIIKGILAFGAGFLPTILPGVGGLVASSVLQGSLSANYDDSKKKPKTTPEERMRSIPQEKYNEPGKNKLFEDSLGRKEHQSHNVSIKVDMNNTFSSLDPDSADFKRSARAVAETVVAEIDRNRNNRVNRLGNMYNPQLT